MKDRGSWAGNVAMKPSFVREQLGEEPVVWVDADARLVQPLRFLECNVWVDGREWRYDFACYRNPDVKGKPLNLCSAVTWWAPTCQARTLLCLWEMLSGGDAREWHELWRNRPQRLMGQAWRMAEQVGLRTLWLPRTYFKKVETLRGRRLRGERVIEHEQASRQERHR